VRQPLYYQLIRAGNFIMLIFLEKTSVLDTSFYYEARATLSHNSATHSRASHINISHAENFKLAMTTPKIYSATPPALVGVL
jgi:hypothetical protein